MSNSLQPHAMGSTPDFPVLHCLLEFAHTHVHCQGREGTNEGLSEIRWSGAGGGFSEEVAFMQRCGRGERLSHVDI